jgi:hypothetical protein
MGPISEGAGLNVTVLSHTDHVDFGFLAAAELVPDVWDMADQVTDGMAELLAAADRLGGSPAGGDGDRPIAEGAVAPLDPRRPAG